MSGAGYAATAMAVESVLAESTAVANTLAAAAAADGNSVVAVAEAVPVVAWVGSKRIPAADG